MLKIFNYLSNISHIDPRTYTLEKELEFYQFIFWGSIVVIILLGIIIYLQRISISGYRKGKESKLLPRLLRKVNTDEEKIEAPQPVKKIKAMIPMNLLDPGLIFKFTLSRENIMDKLITIGQTEGNIKTYSTEVLNNHLSMQIRILEKAGDEDIDNLPEKIIEEYQIDLRRDGSALILYPGIEGYREMLSRERIFLKPNKDMTEDPIFSYIDAKAPLRFRIGSRLNKDGRFALGYFEFHLYTQDYGVTTKSGILKIEKNFLIRLYKIYPGYDTGASTPMGLYPMVPPFITG